MYPFIHLGTELKLPTYLLIISLAYCLCLLFLLPRAKRLKMNANIALDLALIIMVCGFLGARFLHIFYEEPSYYFQEPLQALYFWNGGFVFLGGLLGALLGVYAYLKKKGESFLAWVDFYAPFAPLGYAIGRIGCFLNGCCYGKACALPWAVEFPHILPHGIGRHPTQIYVVIWEVLLLILILNLHKVKKLKTGSLFFTWLLLSSMGRLVMEYFREDDRGAFIFNLSISTWISLILITVSGLFLFRKNNVVKLG